MAGGKDEFHDENSSWIFDDDDDPSGQTDQSGGFTSHIPGADEITPPPFKGGSSSATIVMGSDDSGETVIGGMTGFGDEGDDAAEDPVVGWLVVVKGQGIGHSITLGPGINSVGRDKSERAAVPFGDKRISSKDHVKIVYDNQSRAFLVAPGSGKNPTRIELPDGGGSGRGAIIMAAQPLPNYAVIQLSEKTSVRFVAFCNENFDWSDLIDEDKAH